jgi:hypothetical protein
MGRGGRGEGKGWLGEIGQAARSLLRDMNAEGKGRVAMVDGALSV